MIIVNNRDKLEWLQGITVQDVLDKMGYSYSLITIIVNDKYVPKDEYDHFELIDNSNINIFHLAHGG